MVKRGDIFLGNFGNKEKVMVVLQDSILNERLSTVVVAPIEPHRDGQRVFKNEVLLPERETRLAQLVIATVNVLLAQVTFPLLP